VTIIPHSECEKLLKVTLLLFDEAKTENARLREALEQIKDQDPVENALDPQWAARVAREALNPGEKP